MDVNTADPARDGPDLPQLLGGGRDVAAKQIDLGAQLVHLVVIRVRRRVGQRIDQLGRLGRVAPGQHCLGGVDGGGVGVAAALAGGLQAA
jgi:hypothetical protein